MGDAKRFAVVVMLSIAPVVAAAQSVEPTAAIRAECPAGAGGRAMPDLGALILHTDPRLLAGGPVIKGLYYGRTTGGANDLVAFRLGCDGRLATRPFLTVDFTSGEVLLDRDADGCADGAATLEDDGIDPADYLRALDPGQHACTPSLDRAKAPLSRPTAG